jgi:hypothetical protein
MGSALLTLLRPTGTGPFIPSLGDLGRVALHGFDGSGGPVDPVVFPTAGAFGACSNDGGVTPLAFSGNPIAVKVVKDTTATTVTAVGSAATRRPPVPRNWRRTSGSAHRQRGVQAAARPAGHPDDPLHVERARCGGRDIPEGHPARHVLHRGHVRRQRCPHRLGLATAIAVDATIVRLVLVPATMSLLGPANWWLPAWLDRILPGHAHQPCTDEPAATRECAGAMVSDH